MPRGCGIVEFPAKAAGILILVDGSLIRAFSKGMIGLLAANGTLPCAS